MKDDTLLSNIMRLLLCILRCCSGQILTRNQDQDTCPTPSGSPEDISKDSHPSDSPESSIQNIPKTIFSSQGIERPEDIHPPETGPFVLSKTTSATNSTNSYICGVRYAARSFHVSHMMHDSYFNVSSYRKQQILIPQSMAKSPPLQKNRNV